MDIDKMKITKGHWFRPDYPHDTELYERYEAVPGDLKSIAEFERADDAALAKATENS